MGSRRTVSNSSKLEKSTDTRFSPSSGQGTLPRARPKNLIFASPGKPDLRFRDAVDNDIEIVTGRKEVLVYDEPIRGALPVARSAILVGAARANRGARSRETEPVPASFEQSTEDIASPTAAVQSHFSSTFERGYPACPRSSPRFGLHYDPKTVRERGKEALLRQRMDYLMLLPAGVRIVLEVDGQHHYSSDGRAAPKRYAELVYADRELKLCGYDVYRFGASELKGGTGQAARRLVLRRAVPKTRDRLARNCRSSQRGGAALNSFQVERPRGDLVEEAPPGESEVPQVLEAI